MSLGDALSIAMAGLRANQAAMSLVSSNVANAETPGYVRKTVDQVTTNTGSTGSGVNINGINRELDEFVQTQLRTETSGAGYASLKSDFLQQLQGLYGNPDSSGTLEDSFNALTAAVQALGTSPDSQSARIGVINAAQTIAGQLNAMSNGIQTLRGAAETGIKDAVANANTLMKQIADINNKLQTNPLGGTSTDSSTAALLDQRDRYVTQLSQLMDIRVTTNSVNQITVFTGAGVQLVGNEAATLSFNAQGTVTPSTTWNSQSSLSSLGSIKVSYSNGGSIDLTSTIKSGEIAAYVEARDKTLVEAQNQIDQFAATLASSLSDKTTAGTPVTVGTQAGQTIDTAGMMTGNVMHVTVTDATTGTQRNISIVRVDDPSVLPLPNSATNDPNDVVVGIDFSQPGTVIAQLNAALNPSNLYFTGTSSSINVLNNPGFSTVTAASVTTTLSPTNLTSGGPEVALFTDNGAAYSGAIGGSGSQITGLAQRLSVNNGLVADPSRLVVFSTSPLTASGDSTRADFITRQLTKSTYSYSPQTGVGSSSAPFKGTLLSYMQQFTAQQGAAAQSAAQVADGQTVVLNTLEKKFSDVSGVNMDEEMAHLLSLQNAYSANARVMSTVNQMYQTLMQAF
ncbi:flagellar hook-associated protein 1 FlgK [Rhodopseudomonas rhenobacensis]|uniref:Flagellar hook-associated protein 1 n=1 Tax=Rhodopseudomonas rhenobacensis TaxID=87461 RepID=A0A7W7Z4M5_9BRAD|nr:flagellar hook-associated protein FlgK [Rhodopseudomonas rhenobacensis]MBB5047547.1 flagellar hook-associated protein 1 FlgK [Rhodopseudomonas rhenobacensis]